MEVKGIWSLTQTYIPPDRITKDWSIICYAAKWLFDPVVMGKAVTPEEVINRTEKSIIFEIWKLLDEAHIVVTQNGISFDIRSLNAKFQKHGLPPPSKFLNVDTKVVAKSVFRLPSYKLDYMAKEILGIDGKHDMTMADWDRCNEGSTEALEKMLAYCKNDIAPLLEDLYLVFLPWIPNHPNLNLYTGSDAEVCPRCEGKIEWNGSTYPTPQGLWEGWRCSACGCIGRGSGKKHKISSTEIKV